MGRVALMGTSSPLLARRGDRCLRPSMLRPVQHGRSRSVIAVLSRCRKRPAQGASTASSYTLAMTRPTTHLFEVNIALETSSSSGPSSVELQMPLWQPGRYSNADFAKNVQEFSVTAGSERLPFEKIDTQTWRVQTRGNSDFECAPIRFSETISREHTRSWTAHTAISTAAKSSCTWSGINRMTLNFASSRRQAGARSMDSRNGRTKPMWKYPNYDLLIDNPTEIGPDWTLDEFTHRR